MSTQKSRIFDPNFRYIPAEKTDIRRTFMRERKRLRDAQKVVPMQTALRKIKR